jgi:hypothetical protein
MWVIIVQLPRTAIRIDAAFGSAFATFLARRTHDHRTNRNGAGDEGHEKGQRWRTSRQRRAQGQGGEEGHPKKKAPRSARNDAREGSKTATILEMLKRSGGATAKELLKATSWQPHSLRGFKKLSLNVESFRSNENERTYRVK